MSAVKSIYQEIVELYESGMTAHEIQLALDNIPWEWVVDTLDAYIYDNLEA